MKKILLIFMSLLFVTTSCSLGEKYDRSFEELFTEEYNLIEDGKRTTSYSGDITYSYWEETLTIYSLDIVGKMYIPANINEEEIIEKVIINEIPSLGVIEIAEGIRNIVMVDIVLACTYNLQLVLPKSIETIEYVYAEDETKWTYLNKIAEIVCPKEAPLYEELSANRDVVTDKTKTKLTVKNGCIFLMEETPILREFIKKGPTFYWDTPEDHFEFFNYYFEFPKVDFNYVIYEYLLESLMFDYQNFILPSCFLGVKDKETLYEIVIRTNARTLTIINESSLSDEEIKTIFRPLQVLKDKSESKIQIIDGNYYYVDEANNDYKLVHAVWDFEGPYLTPVTDFKYDIYSFAYGYCLMVPFYCSDSVKGLYSRSITGNPHLNRGITFLDSRFEGLTYTSSRPCEMYVPEELGYHEYIYRGTIYYEGDEESFNQDTFSISYFIEIEHNVEMPESWEELFE